MLDFCKSYVRSFNTRKAFDIENRDDSSGKAYYRNSGDLVPSLAAKIEALEIEYICFAIEKCSSVLREYRSAMETITDKLLEKGKVTA
ncbi:Probable inactive ATP-dependent zinc metalloprotease FTSHI 4, chloroplastic [Dionaea muscipula]